VLSLPTPIQESIFAILALAGWSLSHGLIHLLIDGAFEGLPRKRNPDKLSPASSRRMFG